MEAHRREAHQEHDELDEMFNAARSTRLEMKVVDDDQIFADDDDVAEGLQDERAGDLDTEALTD